MQTKVLTMLSFFHSPGFHVSHLPEHPATYLLLTTIFVLTRLSVFPKQPIDDPLHLQKPPHHLFTPFHANQLQSSALNTGTRNLCASINEHQVDSITPVRLSTVTRRGSEHVPSSQVVGGCSISKPLNSGAPVPSQLRTHWYWSKRTKTIP